MLEDVRKAFVKNLELSSIRSQQDVRSLVVGAVLTESICKLCISDEVSGTYVIIHV